MPEQNETQAEQNQNPAQDQGQQAQEEKKPTDWKAEARKWEARAKENSDAAAELQKLKESQMSELEKAQAKAQQFEAENNMLKAQKALAEYIEGAASETGAPIQFLKLLGDESTVDQFCELWKEYQKEQDQEQTLQPIHSAPRAQQQRIISSQNKGTAKRDLFAQFFGE